VLPPFGESFRNQPPLASGGFPEARGAVQCWSVCAARRGLPAHTPEDLTMSDLARTALAIDKDLLKRFDGWMDTHGYGNRSEAVRDLMRSALVEEEWANPKAQVVAVLSIIYEHSSYTLAQQLASLQHEDHHAILCSQHVHLDHDRCLEVILLQGQADQLRRIADAIIAMRGVKAGKLTLMSKNV
jgi:CopG family nickel-responsive transcriptional regulator